MRGSSRDTNVHRFMSLALPPCYLEPQRAQLNGLIKLYPCEIIPQRETRLKLPQRAGFLLHCNYQFDFQTMSVRRVISIFTHGLAEVPLFRVVVGGLKRCFCVLVGHISKVRRQLSEKRNEFKNCADNKNTEHYYH
jgi:hypothetical protein